MSSYKFGELFTYDYIDGDNTVIGGCIEYVNVRMLIDINSLIRMDYKFERALLDMNTGIFTFYKKYEDGVGMVYTIQ